MFKVYFDVRNGEVIKPFASLPRYYVVLNWKMNIKEIYTCFSKRNIQTYGEDWKENQLKVERDDWNTYSWLMRSLKKYIRDHFLDILFCNKKCKINNNMYILYTYIKFWG